MTGENDFVQVEMVRATDQLAVRELFALVKPGARAVSYVKVACVDRCFATHLARPLLWTSMGSAMLADVGCASRPEVVMCREVAKLDLGPRVGMCPPNVAEVASLLLESRVSSPSCATDSQFNRFKTHSYSSDKPFHG